LTHPVQLRFTYLIA